MMRSLSNLRRQSLGRLTEWFLAVAVCATLLLGGCQVVGKQRIIPCPLAYREQAREILNVVPLGTARKEVVKKLTAVGIEGSFGQSALHHQDVQKSIYYCDVWNRDDGKRWHVNVALLFNSSGELYGTRPGESNTGIESAIIETSDAASADETPANADEGASGSRSFEATPKSPNANRQRGRSRRTPFLDPADVR